MRRLLAFCGAVTLLGAGCGGDRAAASPALVGAWEQQAATAGANAPPWQRLAFEDDGRALWIVGTFARNDTFAIRYRLDDRRSPAAIDLYGFERGSLRGRTLQCIADLSRVAAAGSFRMDCDPGAARPADFTGQTVTYVRAR